jgi:hypothetical protein
MARYMAAATKISRLAVSSPDNRTVTQMYKVEFGTRQDERMNEDMPLGTHGGMSIRHTFPLDGQYGFAIRLARDGTVSTINGIEENEHEVEVRIDYALVKRFTIGGRFKGQDPGVLIAVPEDDLEGQKLRLPGQRRQGAASPRAGQGGHAVTVAFTDSLPSPETGARPWRQRSRRIRHQPAVDMFYISARSTARPQRIRRAVSALRLPSGEQPGRAPCAESSPTWRGGPTGVRHRRGCPAAGRRLHRRPAPGISISASARSKRCCRRRIPSASSRAGQQTSTVYRVSDENWRHAWFFSGRA